MKAQRTLPTRCLCVALSFLATVTPVPALAQEVLPSVAVAQDVFPLVAGVVQLVPSMRIHPVGLLAPSLADDGAYITIGEIRARSTNAGDATQPLPVSDARAAVMAAEADASRDISGTKWKLIGLAGMYVLPMVAAYAVHPDPPATRLIGKTPEYTAFYVETWKDRTKHRRVKNAWIGLGISFAAFAGGSLFICAASGEC